MKKISISKSSLVNLIMVIITMRFLYISRIVLLNEKFYYALYYGLISFVFISYLKLDEESIKKKLNKLISENKYLLFLGIYIALLLLKIFFSKNFKIGYYSPIKEIFNYINLLISILLGLIIAKYTNEDRDIFEKLIKVLFFSMLITILTTLIYLNYVDQFASRRGQGIKFGVADFSFIYSSIFLLPLIFNYSNIIISFRSFRKLKLNNYLTYSSFIKVIHFFVFGLLVVFTINTGFMISTLFVFYIYALLIFVNYFNIKIRNIFKYHLLLFVSIIAFRPYISNTLYSLSKLFKSNWVVSNKLLAISNLLSGQLSTDIDTLIMRFNLGKTSLVSFINNPLIGIKFNEYGPQSIGNHTQWIDELSRMGLLTFFLFGFLKRFYLQYVRNNVDTVKITFFIFILLGFFNPVIFNHITFILFAFIFIPNISKNNERYNSESKSLVSVVVPVYNAREKIVETVYSILNQTYTNLDIILVDDGSTDDTLEVLTLLAKVDDRIKVISKRNGGVSSARNVGIEESRGEFIAFLDSDDIYLENFIEDTLVCDSDVLFSGFNIKRAGQIEPQFNSDYRIYNSDKFDYIFNYLSRKLNIHTSNWIIKKQLLINKNIKFSEGINWSEDFEFFTNCMINAETIVGTNQYLTCYNDDFADNRLSNVSEKRIKYEIFTSSNIIRSLESSKLDIKEKNKIKRLINEYRLPATIFYTIVSLENFNQYKDKYSIYFKQVSNINGLRSLKLKLLLKKDTKNEK